MGNVNINGIGMVNAGDYDELTINGIGTINGRISCRKLTSYGFTHAEKEVDADVVVTGGYVQFDKKIRSKSMNLKEICVFNSDIDCEDMKVAGTLTVNGEMNVGDLYVIGSYLKLKDLHADKIVIEETIVNYVVKNEVDTIECTSIKADILKCKKLYAKDVILGKDCVVDYLEYSGEINIDSRATVKKMVKI